MLRTFRHPLYGSPLATRDSCLVPLTPETQHPTPTVASKSSGVARTADFAVRGPPAGLRYSRGPQNRRSALPMNRT